jgi:hypothetical protein
MVLIVGVQQQSQRPLYRSWGVNYHPRTSRKLSPEDDDDLTEGSRRTPRCPQSASRSSNRKLLISIWHEATTCEGLADHRTTSSGRRRSCARKQTKRTRCPESASSSSYSQFWILIWHVTATRASLWSMATRWGTTQIICLHCSQVSDWYTRMYIMNFQ